MARTRWILAFVFILGGLFSAGAANVDDPGPGVRVGLESLSLVSATTEKVQLSAIISLASTRHVMLREVAFDQLRINGVPFYASALSGNLVLVPNEKVIPSKPLMLTVYLHDLDNLRPLRALVADGRLSVTGMAYADVILNPATKLMLFTNRARIPVRVQNSLELQMPAAAIGRNAALVLIDGAQAALDNVGSRWQTATKLFSQWRKQLWEQYAPALVLAHSTYQLQDAAGKSFPFDATAIGFRVAGKQVLLPKSVLEPWKFDPSIAASMKQDPSLKVVAYDLAIWPANARLRSDDNKLLADQAWRLSSNQLRLLPSAKGSSESMLQPLEGGKVVKVSVHRRQGPAALGLVEITVPAVAEMKAMVVTTTPASESSSLALFRFPEGVQGREARPELVVISGSSAAGKVRLDAMIDSAGWGSPVISEAGIIGVVTQEDSVVPIAEAAKVLKFKQASAGQ
ncbi:MAG: hypothetical protein ABSD96_04670 [Candidatus Korobacteraceae bacterium]|jgi:hypothetical protein